MEGKEKVGDQKAVKVKVATPVKENIATEMKENGPDHRDAVRK